MNPEELAAKIAELENQNAALMAKSAELEAKIPTPPPVADPDEAYKPKTWKDLDDKVAQKSEAAALKVLQEAEKKKDDERKKQEDDLATQNKKIEDAFKKLEDDKIIESTSDVNDTGGQQRRQILGALVSLGGQHIDKAVSLAKSAWDQGYELEFNKDDATVKFVRAGSAPSANRDQFVASSANRTPSAPQKGKVNLVGATNDLDEVQRRWEAANGKI